MTMFYASSTNGFYDDKININIPAEAIELSLQAYNDLLIGQESGLEIYADDLQPALRERVSVVTPSMELQQLELSVTPRRIREAILGIDNNWLKNLDKQIDDLRKV